ncbi:MAG: hypothetical protein GEU73_16045 [Chloroflexi bacterium]|nr:hypothetical protein [Chloroflexota bacterium]
MDVDVSAHEVEGRTKEAAWTSRLQGIQSFIGRAFIAIGLMLLTFGLVSILGPFFGFGLVLLAAGVALSWGTRPLPAWLARILN